MTNQQLTVNLKLIAAALELSKRDIADIVTLGGMKTSRNRADMWTRSAGATKNATGNSEMAEVKTNRTATITEAEFTAFCVGLKPWLESQAE
ncbi:hypothetical protein [Serratia entomophila]|uniref:hypothetical protein n=1 Tax=Serratia entomophila TaxID=42906 RepID=UPI002178815F|nr:hypothetical protein [Serratia entomophila]CAI1636296.1 Uncharacterised protein [Serratia entomophila]